MFLNTVKLICGRKSGWHPVLRSLGCECENQNRSGDAVLAFSAWLFWLSNARNLIITVIGILIIAPVSQTFSQQNPYEFITGHPRIVMSKYDELALRFAMLEDPLAARLKTELKKDADKLLSAKDLKYFRDKTNSINELSQEYLKRILTLSLAYRIFEDEKYSDKAIDQMMDACAFPDWNPDYFTDAATMTAAMAIGYDWNFYHLDLRQNETIRNKILEFGLMPGLDVYKNPEGKSLVWFKMNNHWNHVCASGLILGALAIGDDFPDVKNQIIYHSVRNLLPTIELGEPDGVWSQGPASWVLANNYLAMAMSAMTSSLGNDFGLSVRPGMDKAATWYTLMSGPSDQTFNFGLLSASPVTIAPALAWYSFVYEERQPNELFRSQVEKQLSGDTRFVRDALFYLSLIWVKTLSASDATVERLNVFEGVIDMVVFNSSGENNKNLYVASKGGFGMLGKQQLDAGTFVIDALGERWICDPPVENLVNISDEAAWEKPGNTNLNHSTLVIGDAEQNPEGECRLLKSDRNAQKPFAIFDLSPAYEGAAKVLRGFRVVDNQTILLRDEITLGDTSQKVRWAVVTDATVVVNGNRVDLSKNGKHFYLEAVSEESIEFEIEAAVAPGFTLVVLSNNGDESKSQINISVMMGTEISEEEDKASMQKLDLWK